MMEMTTIIILEPCKYCKGTAIAGTAGKYVLICEGCDGLGLAWRSRCVAQAPPDR